MALFLSFSPFILLFFLLLASRSDGSESPPPPLSSPTFRFTSPSSDLGLSGGDLLEALGDSSLQWTLSLLSARPCLSSGCRDLLQLWLFGGHPVWGSLPVQVSLDFSTFGIDSSKPLFEGPLPLLNQMASLAKATSIRLLLGLLGWDQGSNLLLFRTTLAVVALIIFWIVGKFCVEWFSSCCCCCCCFCFVVVVVVDVVMLLFCCPLCRVFSRDECHFYCPPCGVLSTSL